MTVVLMALFLACYGAAALVEAWAATVLWRWYIIPAFHAGPLSLKTAIGLSLLAGMVVSRPFSAGQIAADEAAPTSAKFHAAFSAITLPVMLGLMAVGFGWLYLHVL